jgi:hypothetical protein
MTPTLLGYDSACATCLIEHQLVQRDDFFNRKVSHYDRRL